MDLVINGKIINGDLELILEKLKVDSKKFNLLREIRDAGDNLLVTCPYHKNGQERKPSCTILKSRTNPKVPFGTCSCFSCKHSASLPQLVADFFGEDLSTGEDWLVNNFGGERFETNLLPRIDIKPLVREQPELDPSILSKYAFYHPYMWQRKLTKEVVDYFSVGYDRERNALTFPVWDEKNKLRFVTERSVESKKFWIPSHVSKQLLYLLNFATRLNVSILAITEAQIDALTSWGYGMPCCATLGGITEEQVSLLNKSGVRIFITMFDNDEWGKRFTDRFNKLIRKDVLVYNLELPKGKKDINDLSLEEFNKCLDELGIKYRIDITKLENENGGALNGTD